MATILLRLIVAASLIISGMEHSRRPELFLISIVRYEILPLLLVPWFSLVIAYGSLSLGLVMLFFESALCSILAAGLFFMFVTAQIRALANGTEISCGCFGSFGEESIGLLSVGRAAVFALVAGFLASIYNKNERFFRSENDPIGESN